MFYNSGVEFDKWGERCGAGGGSGGHVVVVVGNVQFLFVVRQSIADFGPVFSSFPSSMMAAWPCNTLPVLYIH